MQSFRGYLAFGNLFAAFLILAVLYDPIGEAWRKGERLWSTLILIIPAIHLGAAAASYYGLRALNPYLGLAILFLSIVYAIAALFGPFTGQLKGGLGILSALLGMLVVAGAFADFLERLPFPPPRRGRGRAKVLGKTGGGGVEVVHTVVPEKGTPDFAALEEALNARVIGQDHAITEVVRGLKRKWAGLTRKEKPFSAMLLGPTGTGKTELAKALAEALGRPLVRYDMNQYGQDHTVAGLVGSPPGYVGSDRPGRLYDDLSRAPDAVVLFDEMEKAHPAVLDPLLQLLDEGRFQELSKGLTAYAPDCILLFTTNLMAEDAFLKGGLAEEGLRERLVLKGMRPEFVNRLDTVVAFKPFEGAVLRRLAESQLRRYLERWKAEEGLRAEVRIGEGVVDLILKKVDTRFGARDLQRAIEGSVADPLADAYLSFGGKPRRVEVEARGGDVVVRME